MSFTDSPSFSIAGVTDWTAVGGHGSDAVLRTSEDLAKETARLNMGYASTSAGGDTTAGKGSAERARRLVAMHESLKRNPGAALYRSIAELDEQQGDPLTAAQEFEEAMKLEPSEDNTFAWATELLQHRAIWQAQQVFEKGAAVYPKSARMSAGLGAALFAGARYEDAAAKLCVAAELQPESVEFYRLLGSIEIAAPRPLACVEPKLEQFAETHPADGLAQYFYAMALLKTQPAEAASVRRAEALLRIAVADDPHCGEAYLQLGIFAMSRNEIAAAIAEYRRAIVAAPELSDAHYRLAVAYDRDGEHARAQQEFTLHHALIRQQAAAIEQQRVAVKQFVMVPGVDDPQAVPLR
jgi:Tfp pilus assembly protein PilF